MSRSDPLRAMARNNSWSNHRLLAACAQLSSEDWNATRTSFFPSLPRTLNHIVVVDWFYLDAVERGGRGLALLANDLPFPEIDALTRAQAETDRRLLRFCEELGDGDLDRVVEIDRGDDGVTRETVQAVLWHLFVHQIHHRGQAHAMLSGTSVAPPQLDEYFLDWDLPRRADEIARLGL